jgi:hypothetical protein
MHAPSARLPAIRPLKQSRPDGLGRQLSRLLMIGLGVFVVLLGIVIAPLPGPMGVPVMVVGLILILRSSYTARRWFVLAQRRWPKPLTPIRRLLGRNPPFAQVFWQQILRVERVVTSKGHRVIARLRKKLKPFWRRRPAYQPA